MSFERLLVERRRAIVEDWFHKAAETYPSGMWNLLKKGSNRFANPIGGTLAEATEALYDALLRGADRDELAMLLDTSIRLRAVQSFAPSEAVAFVFELKGAVRRAFKAEIRKGKFSSDLADFEHRVDEAALVAFDTYMGCRERLMKVRSNEARGLTRRLIERAGLSFPDSPPPGEAAPPQDGRTRGATP